MKVKKEPFHKNYSRLWVLCILLISVYIVVILGDTIQIKERQPFMVKRIIDGDTIEIDTGEQVRYIGIDTPEIGQPYAVEATQKNRNLVQDKTILLERDVLYKDRYNRVLGYVWVDDIMVNNELIKGGYAKILTIPPDTKYEYQFKLSQRYAQDHALGLWGGIE